MKQSNINQTNNQKQLIQELLSTDSFYNYKKKANSSFLLKINTFLDCFEKLFPNISLGKKNILETILKSEKAMNFFENNNTLENDMLSLDIEKIIINNFSNNLKSLEKYFIYYIKKYHITEKDYQLSYKESVKKISSLLSDLVKNNPMDLNIFYLFKSIDESEKMVRKIYHNHNYKNINKKYYIIKWNMMFEKIK